MVLVRLCTQGGDTTFQVGMASYLLFNPQHQPNAWAVAGVIALVVLPFTFVGPFVSPVLDRHWRKQTVVICDLVRGLASLAMAATIGTHSVGGGWQMVLYILLLVTLSLNRLQLAALAAGLPHVVAEDEYLDASGIMPMLGPSAAVLFGLTAGAIRVVSGHWLAPWQSDGLVFALAVVLFALGLAGMRGFSPRELGPSLLDTSASLTGVVSNLSRAATHLWERRPAAIAIGVLVASRIGYGMWMCIVVVAHRHHFAGSATDTGLAGVGMWFAATGIGFALSGLSATPMGNRAGIQRTIVKLLAASVLASLVPVISFSPPGLVISGFCYGLCTQGVKICSDTVVQAQASDILRGRVIILYDIVNNLGIAGGTVLAAATLPASGFSVPVMAALCLGLGLVMVAFGAVSRHDPAIYDLGTRFGRGGPNTAASRSSQ